MTPPLDVTLTRDPIEIANAFRADQRAEDERTDKMSNREPWYLEPGQRNRQRGYACAFEQRMAGEISADTFRDYEIMRANMAAAMRGVKPADRLRAVLSLENAARVRSEYMGAEASA